MEQAQETAAMDDARMHELQDAVPGLDEARRTQPASREYRILAQADAVGPHGGPQGACRKKSSTDGKLRPWLSKHGLDQPGRALWSRLHIEQGWENALEAAMRERLGALEVSMPRHGEAASGSDAPPAKLTFFSAATGRGSRTSVGSLPRLADLLRPHDAGQGAVLRDWLQGCHTAPALDEALARRDPAPARRGHLRAGGPCRHPPQRQFLRA
jgi:chromosome segregation protein